MTPILHKTDIPWIKYALKPYDGECPHKCEWEIEGKKASCWVDPLRRFQQPSLNGPIRPIENFKERLSGQLERMRTLPQPVLISNTIDSYSHIETKHKLTRFAITELLKHKWTPVILTKSTHFLLDTDIFTPETWIGVTLTSPDWTQKYEHASSFAARVSALEYLGRHSRAKRWISWEPLDLDINIRTITKAISEIKPDFIVFGSLNDGGVPLADYSYITKQLYTLLSCTFDVPFFFKKELVKQVPEGLQDEINADNTIPWYGSE